MQTIDHPLESAESFKGGVRKVLVHTGFSVKELESPRQFIDFVAVATQPAAEGSEQAVVCFEDRGGPMSLSVFTQVLSEVGQMGLTQAFVISLGGFSREVIGLAAQKGISLSDRVGYERALAALPKYENTQKAHTAPPPLPSSLASSSLDKKPRKFSPLTWVIVAIGIVVVSIGEVAPRISNQKDEGSNSDGFPTSDSHPSVISAKRNAQDLVHVAAAAKAADLDFVQLGLGNLQNVIRQIAAGRTIADPNSAHYQKVFGLGNSSLDSDDFLDASRFLRIENGELVYSDVANPFPEPMLGVPSGQALPKQQSEVKLDERLRPLVELNIPDDARTWANSGKEAARTYLSGLYKIAEIEDPELKTLGEALVEHRMNRLRSNVFDKGAHKNAIEKILNDVESTPELACGIMPFLGPAEKSLVAYRLVKNFDHIESSIIRYHAAAQYASKVDSEENKKRVYTELASVFEDSNGLRDYPDGVQFSILVSHQSGEFCSQNQTQFIEFLDEAPEVDQWIKDYFVGVQHIAAAWQSRGDGYAGTVSQEGWNGFTENLEAASERFQRSYSANPNHPASATKMIVVSKGLSDSLVNVRMWFDRAISARADYDQAYSEYLDALQPRWMGSDELLAEFGKACLNTGRFDTVIPMQLLKAHQYRDRDWEHSFRYWEQRPPSELADIEELFRGKQEHLELESQKKSHYTVEAVVYYLLENTERARRSLDRINYEIDRSIVEDYPLSESLLDHYIDAALKAKNGE